LPHVLLDATAALPHSLSVPRALISVVEMPAYLRDAVRVLSEEERAAAVDLVAANPQAGDLIPGGGGIRKVRLGFGGRGKRGGARVIYYHHSDRIPVFLLALFAKNERADLTRAETSELARIVKTLAKTYGVR
jgi:hypothetical protein